MKTRKGKKQKYISPAIKVEVVVLEQCLAAGSANVKPTDGNDDVKDTWGTDSDNNQTIQW